MPPDHPSFDAGNVTLSAEVYAAIADEVLRLTDKTPPAEKPRSDPHKDRKDESQDRKIENLNQLMREVKNELKAVWLAIEQFSEELKKILQEIWDAQIIEAASDAATVFARELKRHIKTKQRVGDFQFQASFANLQKAREGLLRKSHNKFVYPQVFHLDMLIASGLPLIPYQKTSAKELLAELLQYYVDAKSTTDPDGKSWPMHAVENDIAETALWRRLTSVQPTIYLGALPEDYPGRDRDYPGGSYEPKFMSDVTWTNWYVSWPSLDLLIDRALRSKIHIDRVNPNGPIGPFSEAGSRQNARDAQPLADLFAPRYSVINDFEEARVHCVMLFEEWLPPIVAAHHKAHHSFHVASNALSQIADMEAALVMHFDRIIEKLK